MLSPAHATDGTTSVPLDTRVLGYTPLALLLALVIATPAPPRRKLLIVSIGGTVLLARLAIGIALPVARLLGNLGADSALAPAAEVVWWAFIATPAISYAAPLVSWGLAFTATTPSSSSAPSSSRPSPRRLKARRRSRARS